MLFGMLDVVLDHLAKIDKRFPWNQFRCKGVVDWRQNFFLNFAQRDSVIGFFSCQFLHREVVWKIHDHEARSTQLLSYELLAEFWQKIISRQMQPEFLAAL